MFGGRRAPAHKLTARRSDTNLYLGDDSTRLRGGDTGAELGRLVENVITVRYHRDYFPANVAEWQQRNAAWEAYVKQISGSDLIDK